MTPGNKGIRARWWISLAALAALICLGLAASNTLAASPPSSGLPTAKTGNAAQAANTGNAAQANQSKGNGTSVGGNTIAPSPPLTCSTDYVVTTSTGAIDP